MADFRVVSENSEQALMQREAVARLAASYRNLVANMLRVVRGAGRSSDLRAQIKDVLAGYQLYQEAFGYPPSSDVLDAFLNMRLPDDDMLSKLEDGRIQQSDIDRWENNGDMDRLRAEATICRGALQKVASQFAGQITQQRLGERELHDGVRALENARHRIAEAHKAPSRPRRK